MRHAASRFRNVFRAGVLLRTGCPRSAASPWGLGGGRTTWHPPRHAAAPHPIPAPTAPGQPPHESCNVTYAFAIKTCSIIKYLKRTHVPASRFPGSRLRAAVRLGLRGTGELTPARAMRAGRGPARTATPSGARGPAPARASRWGTARGRRGCGLRFLATAGRPWIVGKPRSRRHLGSNAGATEH